MVRLLPLASLVLVALLSACNNPCQGICTRIAAYARECGFEPTADDMAQCREEYATANLVEGDAEDCVEASDPVQLREWWTCEELGQNYQSAAN